MFDENGKFLDAWPNVPAAAGLDATGILEAAVSGRITTLVLLGQVLEDLRLVHGFDRGIVYLHMQGACAGCPSSTLTLKMGIENLLRHYIPEVTEVRPVAA